MEKGSFENKAYQYWLYNIPGLRKKNISTLLSLFGNEKLLYHASDRELKRDLTNEQITKWRDFSKNWDINGCYEILLKKNIKFVTIRDMEYPRRLADVKSAPKILYYQGNLPDERKPAAAVIGARECSDYGKIMAREFAGKLASRGVDVISGMARGIDCISQEEAVKAGGCTYAVLGCGVDICYPASNRKLYEVIKETGGILSSFPPGTEAKKTNFPERNRIVAGISDLVLVVEARQKSGTFITVDMALDQGKDVYTIPGRITDRLSDGCNLLIRQGAGIALTPEDLLAEFKMLKDRRSIQGAGDFAGGQNGSSKLCSHDIQQKKEQDRADDSIRTDRTGMEAMDGKNNLTEEGQILGCLDIYPRSVDEIYILLQNKKTEITMSRLMFLLIQLCMDGKAVSRQGNYFMLAENINVRW